MKTFRLLIHKASVSSSSGEEELVVNPADFSIGEVLELYHPDDESSRVILQVTAVKSEAKVGQIRVSQKVSSVFQLKHQRDVVVRPANLKEVMLELVELEMKDNYVSRSDMWRLKRTLQEKCVYTTKKLEFSGIRTRVSGLWTSQTSVMSGYVDSDTKIVFRSSSCTFYILIQMSREMWEFDPYGDLYFERSVGFLRDLFDQWRVKECSHEVSLILFSRTWYGGVLPGDFSPFIRDSVEYDPTRGCFQDFYKVVAHGESISDFGSLIIEFKRCFSHYLKWVDCCREIGDATSRPEGRLSLASNGNVLEAVNLALTAFERHHVDQQFDKVGQQILVVTPSVGLFQVDRRLTYITKQRTLNDGIGIDLVCLSAQPLHAAPLFMFRRLIKGSQSGGNDYDIPYWINCCFHTSEAQAMRNKQGKFIPRISMPDFNDTSGQKSNRPCTMDLSSTDVEEPKVSRPLSFTEDDKLQRVDYDAYDALVFNVHVRGQRRISRLLSSNTETAHRNLETLDLVGLSDEKFESLLATSNPAGTVKEELSRQGSFEMNLKANDRDHLTSTKESVDVFGYRHGSRGTTSGDLSTGFGSLRTSHLSRHGKHNRGFYGSVPLVNPFAPSRVPSNLSFHSRSSWSLTFRHDVAGQCIQEHRVVQEEPLQMASVNEEEDESVVFENDTRMSLAVLAAAREAVFVRIKEQAGLDTQQTDKGDNCNLLDSSPTGVSVVSQSLDVRSLLPFFTPPTSPQKYKCPPTSTLLARDFSTIPASKWRLELIGMDWKSLITPACLPLTTKFFPKNLDNEYYENPYSLSADDSGLLSGRQALTPEEIYHELISQRLCKGYQLINATSRDESQVQTVSQSLCRVPTQQRVYLTMGKSHHLIKLNEPQVEVTIFKPKHQQSTEPFQYRYRLWGLKGNDFQAAAATFHKDLTDDFNWNYLDHYVCGDTYFKDLVESLRYWRCRFLLLPVVMDMKADCCAPDEVINRRINGFMQFLEALHKLRRPSSLAKSRAHTRHASIPAEVRQQLHDHSLKKALSLAGYSPPVLKKSTRHLSLKPPDCADEHDQLAWIGENSDSKDQVDSAQVNRLTENSTLEEILAAMKDTVSGIEVLETASGHIKDCFLGCDLVTWLMANVSGLDSRKKAALMAQKLVQNRYVAHASGDSGCRIVDGFYLYRTVTHDQRVDVIDASFRDTWMEVNVEHQQLYSLGLGQAVFHHPLMSTPTPNTPPTPSRGMLGKMSGPNVSASVQQLKDCESGPRKTVTVNVDAQGKSDRPEWCTVQYDSTYSSGHAFCIEFRWLVATPSLISDVIASWSRRASQSGFHLVPVPVHPMSQPHQTSGKPFQAPQFLALDLTSPSVNRYLVQGNSSPKHLLFLMQEGILARFNFLVDRPAGTKAQVSESTLAGAYRTTYVHESGSVFVHIADPNPARDGSPSRSNSPMKGGERPHLDLSIFKGHASFEKPGFHWSPNHLISKRWKSPVAGDVEIADKLWHEITCFCQNTGNCLDSFLVDVGFLESTE